MQFIDVSSVIVYSELTTLYVPLPLRGVAITVLVVNTGYTSSALLATHVVCETLPIIW